MAGNRSIIDQLPEDIWVNIACKVVNNSTYDLFRMRSACKLFRHVGKSQHVYKNASLFDIGLEPFSLCIHNSTRLFLEQCKLSCNAKALFRFGFDHYFAIRFDTSNPLYLIRMAAMNGHLEAMYFYSVLVVCSNELEENTRHVVQFVQRLITLGALEKCRDNIRCILLAGTWWVRNIPLISQQRIVCRASTCSTSGSMPQRHLQYKLNEGSINVTCVECRLDFEVLVFFDILSRIDFE
ncbi:hypothetical protein PIB30_047851 [Stylosanthes scabra]|uniref:At2g35280-like TPR domain-containing protein n=1 Tax=Stylosanthes scabra TaxID=79078 RepID=A0ABU6UFQ7_9FABA|nr:hypothetical protein [Stylosanthes scabra]